MSANKYLVTMLASIALCFAIATALFCAHLGLPWWPHHLNREVRMAKHYMAETVEGPTIWLQGGSSAWFGFDSPLLQTETGYNVVNLAFNVNMPTEFCFDEIRRFAQPGDVAVLALENSMYFRDNYASYAVDELSIWDPGFFWSLSLKRKGLFLKSLPWRKVLATDLVRLGQLTGSYQRALKPIGQSTLIENLHARWDDVYSGKIPVYYNYLTLNRHGDFVHSDHALWRGESDYSLKGSAPVSTFMRRDLEEFAQWAQKNDVRIFMSWIPMARNPRLDLTDPRAVANIAAIQEFVQSHSLTFLGQPEDFLMDIEYFYDTSHHTTAAGATERTQRFLPFLLKALDTDQN